MASDRVLVSEDMTVGQLRAAYNALGVTRCLARVSDRGYLAWEVRLRFADLRHGDVVGEGVDVVAAVVDAVRKATAARGA